MTEGFLYVIVVTNACATFTFMSLILYPKEIAVLLISQKLAQCFVLRGTSSLDETGDGVIKRI